MENKSQDSYQKKMAEIQLLWEREVRGMRCGLPNKTLGAIPADFINKAMNSKSKLSESSEDAFSGLCE